MKRVNHKNKKYNKSKQSVLKLKQFLKLIFSRSLVALSRKLWDLNIPLIVCKSIGFIAYMRVQTKEHPIVETHPDNEGADLRLDRPFKCLQDHFDSINLDAMDLKDHSHVPYVVVLYKYLQKWLQLHKNFPKSFKEKEEFREFIRSGIRKDEHGNPVDEENFEEAIRAVNTCIKESEVPSNIKDILNDPSCLNATAKVIRNEEVHSN